MIKKEETDFDVFYKEALDLLEQNNEELNFYERKLNVNYQLYLNLMQMNNLKVFTLRKEDNTVVGYSVYFIGNHAHHVDMISATQDTIYINPKFRFYALSFINWCDEKLKEYSVEAVLRQVTKFNNWSLLLSKLKYEEIETVYMKKLKG